MATARGAGFAGFHHGVIGRIAEVNRAASSLPIESANPQEVSSITQNAGLTYSNYTIPAGDDQILIVAAQLEEFYTSGSGLAVDTVAFGASAMTKIDHVTLDSANHHHYTSLWYLLDPSGTADVVMTATPGAGAQIDHQTLVVCTFNNIGGSAPTLFTTGTALTSAINTTLNSVPANAMVVDCFIGNSDANPQTVTQGGSGQSSLVSHNEGNTAFGMSKLLNGASPANVTMGWTGALERITHMLVAIDKSPPSTLFTEAQLQALGAGTGANSPYQLDIGDGTTLDTVSVTGNTELASALSSATAGDLIQLQDATYSTSEFTLSASGTEANPIIIDGRDRDTGVVFTGQLTISGDWVIVKGINFSTGGVRVNGDNVRVTRNLFTSPNKNDAGGVKAGVDVRGSASWVQVDRNEVDDPDNVGIRILNAGTSILVEKNYVHNIQGSSANAHEPIAAQYDPDGASVIPRYIILRENLVTDTHRDGEAISLKCSYSSMIGNTLTNSATEKINIRRGSFNLVLRNYIDGSEGMAFRGANNTIVGNRVDGDLLLRAGDSENTTTNASSFEVCEDAFVGDNYDVDDLWVGIDFGSESPLIDARDNVVEQSNTLSGSVILDNETGTTQPDTNSYPVILAVQLTTGDVGPGAS